MSTNDPASGLVWRAEPERARPERANVQGGADPVMVRAYAGDHKGATAFFRNRPLLRVATAFLASKCPDVCRVLFHACSVGAEPYSLACWWHLERRDHRLGRLEISATDIEPSFLRVAEIASYPNGVVQGMTPRERELFVQDGSGLRVADEVRSMVRFLPATSFVDGQVDGEFDAVFVMNALTYVSAEQQSAAIARCAASARHLLGLTAFHPETIKRDVGSAGFAPLVTSHREIHEAWGDRLVNGPVAPASNEYSWQLPPYDTPTIDREWRYGSLFIRNGLPQNGELEASRGKSIN